MPAPGRPPAALSAVRAGGSGIISIGIAGGLAPGLAPGNWVIASGVVADGQRIPTDERWSRKLLSALPGAVHADISGVDATVFPYLKLKLKTLDTVKFTPYQLRYWRVTYAPVPEGKANARMSVKNGTCVLSLDANTTLIANWMYLL
mgnify:CR=1 FL=1